MRICYEADAGGYEFYRQLRDWDYSCEVMAPSLSPKKPGDRRKNDKRDARQGAKSYRAGELTPIAVPSAQREEDRALVRLRSQLVKAQQRFKHQLRSTLRLQGFVFRDGKNWTKRHLEWIRSLELTPGYDFLRTQLLLQIDLLELAL